MAQKTTRTFEHQKARRQRVALLLALYGPSGGGKTKSALRLADGIRRVSGGKVFVIDTEARRALHYADEHDFEHVPFAADFGPLDYLTAIEHCQRNGAGVIIVDSMSHEHEGPGGVLEMHAREVERMAGDDWRKAERVKMLAWQKPKSERRRMINTILQMPLNFIFCFRAKEKLLIQKGKDPEPRGFMPITGEEFVYEMTATALLLPCADGVPTWESQEIGERMMIKRPAQFRAMLDRFRGQPLCEDIGEAMARWAAGDAGGSAFDRLAAAFATAPDDATIKALGDDTKAALRAKQITRQEAERLGAAAAERRAALSSRSPTEPPRDPLASMSPTATLPEERQPGDEG